MDVSVPVSWRPYGLLNRPTGNTHHLAPGTWHADAVIAHRHSQGTLAPVLPACAASRTRGISGRALARAILLVLPAMIVVRGAVGLTGPVAMPLYVAGAGALLLCPGYWLLAALRQEPLGQEAAETWWLVLPASLAVDALLGVALALSPLGLSSVTLGASLTIFCIAALLGAMRR